MLATAKRLILKDERQAERTLKIRARKRSRRNKHVVGIKVWTDPKWLQKIVDETGGIFNPHWIEYGASGHETYGKGSSPLRPHPFMRPAYDQNKATFKAIMTAEVRRIIHEVAK